MSLIGLAVGLISNISTAVKANKAAKATAAANQSVKVATNNVNAVAGFANDNAGQALQKIKNRQDGTDAVSEKKRNNMFLYIGGGLLVLIVAFFALKKK